MSKIARFFIWICSKFTKGELEQIVSGLIEVLADRNPEVKPKDDFKEKYPRYRNFSVDPPAPLTEPRARTGRPAKGALAVLFPVDYYSIPSVAFGVSVWARKYWDE